MKLDIEKIEFKNCLECGYDFIDEEANAKIATLEQQLTSAKEQLKQSISIDAHLEWKREWEQQLKKAEEVIEFYGKQDNWCLNGYKAGSLLKGSLKDSEEVNDNETLNHIGGKLARQYLKSRGE